MSRKYKFNDNDKLYFGLFIQRHKYAWQKAKLHTCANSGEVGMQAFYTVIGKESLVSAGMNGKLGYSHNTFWTETWANYLSSNHFASGYFANPSRFPIQNISTFNLIRLRLASPLFWP